MSLKIPKDEVWIMKDGTKVQVKDMTESHVKNVLRMIIRREKVEEDWEDVMEEGSWMFDDQW